MPTTEDLRARLASLAGKSTLRITTRGRRTGKPHTVTIWFLVEGTTVYIGTLNARRDWVRNVTKDPAVELDLGGLRVRGRATRITDPALDARVGAMLVRKYWIAWIASWFGAKGERSFRVDGLEATA